VGNVVAICRRELKSYFASPVAYVVLMFFLLIAGYFFYAMMSYFSLISLQMMQQQQFRGMMPLNVTEAVIRPLFGNLSVVFIFLLPALTMRSFAEEKKTGTIELLLSYPIRDGELVTGKYLATLALLAVMLAATVIYPLFIGWTTEWKSPEFGPLLASYLGLFLMGACFLAFGLFASTLTENQIVAFVITLVSLLMFWVLGWAASFVGTGAGAVLNHLSFIQHFDNFAKGVIDTTDMAYYLSFIAFCLFLTLRSLESKNWRA
jgi:ABC-2 type transport system permease protein